MLSNFDNSFAPAIINLEKFAYSTMTCAFPGIGSSLRMGSAETSFVGRFIWCPDMWCFSRHCFEDSRANRSRVFCRFHRHKHGMPYRHCG